MNYDLVIHCDALTKSYQIGPELLCVIDNLEFEVARGELVGILGSSGSGKTTLLNLLGGLDNPTSGSVTIAGQLMGGLSEKKRGILRNKHMGFVYQFHHLLAEFTALENVAMPLLIRSFNKKIAFEKAEVLLERVGLKERKGHKPSELSGGERQRVAIARALVTGPDIILMDEPTGNLDQENALNIQSLLIDLSEKENTSMVIVTHDEGFAEKMHSLYRLNAGQLSRC
jgi:lipoprotein-releasing system ATP-binding protein